MHVLQSELTCSRAPNSLGAGRLAVLAPSSCVSARRARCWSEAHPISYIGTVSPRRAPNFVRRKHLCLRERECGLRATHSWSPCTQVRIDIYDIRAAFETVGGMLRNTGGVFAFPSPVGKPFIIAKDEAFLRDVSRVKTPWQCTRTAVRALTRTVRC